MANINDFKLIKLKSRKMFDYLDIHNNKTIQTVSDIQKERIGFYHLVLENITGIIDNGVEKYTIIDTEYNKLMNAQNVDDLGMDAVNIEENDNGEIDIQLFNFKYRNAFNADKNTSEKDISRSTKFLEYILNNELLDESGNELVVKQINKIIEWLNSNKVCNIYMYFISNESNGFAANSNQYIKILEKNYGMKIINISLEDILSFYNTKKENRKSSFMISPHEFLSFQSDEKSTQKSYILKLSLLDIIRVFSDDDTLSNNYSIEEDGELLDSKLDYSLLYDNVRGYLGDTKYNKNIIETLNNNHTYFFMFNNGITVTAETIDCNPKNSGVKYLFTIENFQIVNGGQTIRSVFEFLNKEPNLEKLTKLREAYVLVRLFKTTKGDTLQNSIAEYTNSQNAISEIDLKSIDNIQIQIEKFFSEMGILYVRKAGNIGDINKEFRFRISMEKLAQILYSTLGHPDRASNQKRRLFLDYYDQIFKSETFTLEKSKTIAEKYQEVDKLYKEEFSYKVSDQKMFYIMYIITYTDLDIREAIIRLEKLLSDYDSDVAESRKLIQKRFKDFINTQLNINII